MPSRRGRRAAEAPVLLVLDDDEEDGGDDKEVGAQRDNDLDDELVVLLSDDEQPAPQFACTQPGCSRVFKRAAHLAVHAKSHPSAAAKPAPTVTRKQKQPPPPLPPPIDIAADLLPSDDDDDVDAAAQAADLPEDLAMILRGSPVDAEKTKKKKKKTTKKKKKKKRRTSQAVNLLDMNKPSIFVRQQADSDDDQSSDNGDDDNDAGSGVLSLFGARGRKRSRPSSTRARRSDDEGSNDAASEQDDSELAVEPLPVSSESDTDALFDSLRREVDRAVVTAGPASSVAASLITKTLDTVVEAYAAPSDDADGRKSKRSSKRRSNDDDDDDVKGGSNELVCDIAVKDTAGKQLHAPLKMRYLIDKPVGGIVDIVANWFSFSPAGAKLCFDALPVENERTLRDIGMVEGDVLEVVFPAAAAAAAAASDSERGAPITVVVQSNVGEKTSFTLRMNDAFQLLFNAFCKKNGYYADDVVLLFEGERLSLTDTPALLDLDGDEVFDARVKTDASGKPRQCIDSTTTTTTTTTAAAGKKISVGVLLPGGRTTQLRVGAEQRFALLLTELARRQGVAADKIELRLEGEPLPLDRTPRDLDFEGGETIEALIDGPTNPCAEQDDDSDNDEEEEQEDDRAQAEEDAAEGKITLYLQTKTERQSFRMGTTKTFDKLVEAFRARNASVARTAKIALFLDGDKLQLDDTPEDMDLEDEDVIDVRIS